MEDFQPGAVADADDRCFGQLLDQELHHVLLTGFVKRRGRLVHEDPVGLVDQHPGKGDALLLATGEDVVPPLGLIQSVAEMVEAHLVQHVFQGIIGDAFRRHRVVHHLAQRSQREVGLLRHERDVAGRKVDGAAAPGPDPGDGAHDRALAAAGLAADQHPLGPLDLDLRFGDEHLAAGPRHPQFAHDEPVRISRRVDDDPLHVGHLAAFL